MHDATRRWLYVHVCLWNSSDFRLDTHFWIWVKYWLAVVSHLRFLSWTLVHVLLAFLCLCSKTSVLQAFLRAHSKTRSVREHRKQISLKIKISVCLSTSRWYHFPHCCFEMLPVFNFLFFCSSALGKCERNNSSSVSAANSLHSETDSQRPISLDHLL